MSGTETASAVADLPRASGAPVGSARLRSEPEDFVVQELLGFEPSGDGEHVFLYVRKRGHNTDAVAAELARRFGVRRGDVSYAGMKDRWAVTEQWFSVQLPGQETAVEPGPLAEGMDILRVTRNRRKLRRGALAGNRFQLRLREFDGSVAATSARLYWISRFGVPNYFGEQRFGRDGGNVAQARAFFSGELRPRSRNLRGILLSAARSQLFNQLLAARVVAANWNRALPGDVLMLDGRGSVFAADTVEPELEQRVARMAVHPTGPLPGRGGMHPTGEALTLESAVCESEPGLIEGLQRHGVDADRRALRLRVHELGWYREASDVLVVSFRLDAGGYATTVLRELCELSGS